MKKLLFVCLLMIESSFVYLFYTLTQDGRQPFDVKRALLVSIFTFVVTLFLFLRRLGQHPASRNVHYTSHTLDNDASNTKDRVNDLEREFEYAVHEFSEGKRTRFENYDLEVIADYIKFKTGENVYASYNGTQSLILETTNKRILLELVENQIEPLFARQTKGYRVFSNHMPIYQLKELVNTW